MTVPASSEVFAETYVRCERDPLHALREAAARTNAPHHLKRSFVSRWVVLDGKVLQGDEAAMHGWTGAITLTTTKNGHSTWEVWVPSFRTTVTVPVRSLVELPRWDGS